MLGVRRAGGPLDVGARAGAGIDELLGLQTLEGGLVERQAFGLHDGAIVPLEPEPVQIGARFLGSAGLDARRIDVLDAQDDAAILGSSAMARENSVLASAGRFSPA